MNGENNGPCIWVKTFGLEKDDYKTKYDLRSREQRELFFKDLVRKGIFSPNEFARAWYFSESKFWGAKAWRDLKNENKKTKR